MALGSEGRHLIRACLENDRAEPAAHDKARHFVTQCEGRPRGVARARQAEERTHAGR